MSRSHMIYDDRPLQQEGLKTSKWKGKWIPSDLQSGTGVILEGVFQKLSRHVIQDSEGKKIRFCVFHVEFTNACQRKYDSQNNEIEPNFGQMKLVNTGYLNSSYKSELKGTPDLLLFDEVVKRVRSPLTDLEVPIHAHSLCFWGDEENYNHMECEYGQGVRLKTNGDSLLIESFTKLETSQRQYSSNYTGGEKAGQNWTDKVMGFKQQEQVDPTLNQRDKGEVDDDEWDD